MKKALKYIALVFFGFLWFLGGSRDTVVALVDAEIIKDDYRYGDLYRLSNLPEYKAEVIKCTNSFKGDKANVSMFLAGDSFTELGRVKPAEYAASSFKRVFVADRNDSLVLGGGKKILVIETVERHLRERFSEKPWDNWQKLKPQTAANEVPFFERVSKSILDYEVPYKEEMSEATLFSSDWALWFREKKALLNYKVFGKVDPKVHIINGELVYYLDVDPGVSSVYDEVTDEEVSRIVKHANLTRENYRAMGFDEVYLSIIPNKTSLLIKNDDKYNHLLERVENHPDLTIPTISVWKEFSQQNYYQKGDSHWNCDGQKIWVDKVNEKLIANN